MEHIRTHTCEGCTNFFSYNQCFKAFFWYRERKIELFKEKTTLRKTLKIKQKDLVKKGQKIIFFLPKRFHRKGKRKK